MLQVRGRPRAIPPGFLAGIRQREKPWASLFQRYGRSQSRQTQVGYPVGDIRTSAAALDPAECKKFYLDPRRGRQSRDLHPATGSKVLHKLAMVVVHDKALSDSPTGS